MMAWTAIAVSPKAVRHSRTASSGGCSNAIEASGCLATVLAEIGCIVSDDTIVRPDLTIVSEARHLPKPEVPIARIFELA